MRAAHRSSPGRGGSAREFFLDGQFVDDVLMAYAVKDCLAEVDVKER